MEKYYFTFGGGHKIGDVLLEGKCQPIKATDRTTAYNKMLELHGTQWCGCYSQEEWDSYPKWMREEELETIIVKEN